MNISLNGKTHSLADNSSLACLIDALELTGKRIAVEVNDELVPRSEHADCQLNEGDRVEIVQAIGGG
ncbi:MAG: sulfur carrier protein ThiS [Sedimenticolaceae bacterium]|jgi:sulfur carrier protein